MVPRRSINLCYGRNFGAEVPTESCQEPLPNGRSRSQIKINTLSRSSSFFNLKIPVRIDQRLSGPKHFVCAGTAVRSIAYRFCWWRQNLCRLCGGTLLAKRQSIWPEMLVQWRKTYFRQRHQRQMDEGSMIVIFLKNCFSNFPKKLFTSHELSAFLRAMHKSYKPTLHNAFRLLI